MPETNTKIRQSLSFLLIWDKATKEIKFLIQADGMDVEFSPAIYDYAEVSELEAALVASQSAGLKISASTLESMCEDISEIWYSEEEALAHEPAFRDESGNTLEGYALKQAFTESQKQYWLGRVIDAGMLL